LEPPGWRADALGLLTSSLRSSIGSAMFLSVRKFPGGGALFRTLISVEQPINAHFCVPRDHMLHRSILYSVMRMMAPRGSIAHDRRAIDVENNKPWQMTPM
jgi:hypothetical protein